MLRLNNFMIASTSLNGIVGNYPKWQSYITYWTELKTPMLCTCGLVSAIQGDIYKVSIFKNCLKVENYSISSVVSNNGWGGGRWGNHERGKMQA